MIHLAGAALVTGDDPAYTAVMLVIAQAFEVIAAGVLLLGLEIDKWGRTPTDT